MAVMGFRVLIAALIGVLMIGVFVMMFWRKGDE